METSSQDTRPTNVAPKNHSNPLFSNETLERIYENMIKSRVIAERATGMASADAPVVGREAIEVATAVHLRSEDTIVADDTWLCGMLPSGPIGRIVAESPAAAGKVPSVVSASTLTSAKVSVATGVAAACKAQDSSGIVVLFADEAALAPRASEQALAFAGEQSLPIVYVTEKNLWPEIGSVASSTGRNDFDLKAAQYGFPIIPVDGTDAPAIYRVAQEAIGRARRRRGPTLMQCQTFRWYGHRAIDPARFRAAEEVNCWHSSDPIRRMEMYLRKKQLISG